MKQFSLEEYLANPSKKVVTRDGRNARIICTDRKDSNYPIIALIENKHKEHISQYTKDGKSLTYIDDNLYFAPEKHEGWINVYGGDGGFRGGSIYPSKEDANKGKCLHGYITTIKIEWEE